MNRANRPRMSRISGSSYASKLLSRAGDGSTLTLDFTTGVLDSRLTFTRTSNATFINSSGLVQWAAANHAPRTNWNFTSPTGSGWNAATTLGTGTFQWVGNGTVIASSGSSGQAFTSITTSTGIAEGLRYVMSVTAQSVTGSPTIQSIFDFTGASGNTYFKNGATATAGTTVASGDRISVSAVATATTMNVRMGCGAWFANRTNESVTLTQFHWHPGSSPVPYYENTATSPRYDSARFDYDPTTLAPKGLLIEGTATNLLSRSEEFDNTGSWNPFNRTVTSNDGVAPDGNTTADSIQAVVSGNGGVFHTTSVPSGTHTFSVFAKANGANGFTVSVDNSGNGRGTDFTLTGGGSAGTPYVRGTGGTVTSMSSSVQTFPSGWVRCIVTVVTTGTNSVALYTQSGTSKWLAWGAMLEASSGASSYVPTGASTVQRLADNCSIVSPNFAPWYNQGEGTFLLHCQLNRLGAQHLLNVNVNNAAPRLMITEGSNNFNAASENPSGTNFTFALGSSSTNSTKVIAAFKSLDNAGTRNGATVQTNATLTVPTTVNLMRIGSAEGGYQYMTGTISLLKYWPTRLPNATLQSLTT